MASLQWGLVCCCFITLLPVALSQLSVRLEQQSRGRVLIRFNNQEGVVCADYFGQQDAEVICKTVGRANARIIRAEINGMKIWLNRMNCHGGETSAVFCPVSGWEPGYCPSGRAAAVDCQSGGPTTTTTQRPNNNPNFSVRLLGGTNSDGQVIAVWYTQEGAICSQGFDTADAQVVCRMLGFQQPHLATVREQTYNRVQSISLSNINCRGGESSLLECSITWNPGTCPRNLYAGVNCGISRPTIPPPPTPAPFIRVQLLGSSGGSASSSGRVVLSWNNLYGTVCATGFSYQTAVVTCKMLGYTSTSPRVSSIQRTSETILVGRLTCLGNEASLSQCTISDLYPNNCYEIASVACTGGVTTTTTPAPANFRIALVQGSSSSSGRLAVYWYNQQGFVCSNNFDSADARVACRMLNLSTSNVQIMKYSFIQSPILRAWFSDVNCQGHETSFTQCAVTWNPQDCREIVGVSCGASTPTPSNIRVDIPQSSAAIVNWYGRSGAICATNFGYEEARVVCQMAGYPIGDASINWQTYPRRGENVLLTNVDCTAQHTSLQQCNKNWNPASCAQIVGVTCTRGVIPPVITPSPTNIRIDIPQGSATVVNWNGQSGAICATNFGYEEARVVCQMAGYPIGDASINWQSYPRRGENLLLTNVDCTSQHTSLQQCNKNWNPVNCAQIVGVSCTRGVIPPVTTPRPTNIRIDIRQGSATVVNWNGQYGAICATNFGYEDARVVCNMAGYPLGDASINWQVYQRGNENVLFTNVDCLPQHTSLEQCSKDRNPQNCYQIIGVTCSRGVIPPTNLPQTTINPSNIRVELRQGQATIMYWYQQSGAICANNFGYDEARVVCLMAGYPEGDSTINWTSYPRRGETVWIADVDCTIQHNNLQECYKNWNPSSCDDLVGVSCSRGVIPPTQPYTTRAPSGNLDVYLRNGPDYLHGVVVLRQDGLEYTLCPRNFGQQDANVVCNTLTQGRVRQAKLLDQLYGPGPGFTVTDRPVCNGNENHIRDCPRRRVSSSCTHSEDLSIACGELVSGQPAMSASLVERNGQNSNRREGRLQVSYYGQVGTVCADRFDINDGMVACRMLGYSDNGVVVLGTQYGPGSNSIPVLMGGVECGGYEQSLDRCTHSGWRKATYCSHNQDVSLRCGSGGVVPTPPPNTGTQVYLADGPDQYHGRLMIRRNGEEGTVCKDDFDDKDARVICRQLGYNGQGARSASNYYGQGAAHLKIWLDNLDCTGLERDVTECRHNGWGTSDCGHHEDISVFCGPKLTPGPYVTVRLADGPDRYHGRVVVIYNNVEGSVCDDRFDDNAAKVVCRMLGYTGNDAKKTNRYRPASSGRIWLDEVLCSGDETSITNCFTNDLGTTDCQHSEDIGVDCGPVFA